MTDLAQQWCLDHGYRVSGTVFNGRGEHILDRLSEEPNLGRRIVILDAEATEAVFSDVGMATMLGPGHGLVFPDASMVVVLAWIAHWEVASAEDVGPSGLWVDDLATESLDGWE